MENETDSWNARRFKWLCAHYTTTTRMDNKRLLLLSGQTITVSL